MVHGSLFTQLEKKREVVLCIFYFYWLKALHWFPVLFPFTDVNACSMQLCFCKRHLYISVNEGNSITRWVCRFPALVLKGSAGECTEWFKGWEGGGELLSQCNYHECSLGEWRWHPIIWPWCVCLHTQTHPSSPAVTSVCARKNRGTVIIRTANRLKYFTELISWCTWWLIELITNVKC